MKLLVVFMLIMIVASLLSALVYMAKEKDASSGGMVRALTVRIGLSVALFIMLFVFYALGWIQPHGVMPG